MNETRPTLTRKDLALMTGLSIDTIRRKEKALGLSDCRIKLDCKMVLFSSRLAIIALRQRGFSL